MKRINQEIGKLRTKNGTLLKRYTAYADDFTFYYDTEIERLLLFSITNLFAEVSGLKVKPTKTYTFRDLQSGMNVRIMKFLGVHLSDEGKVCWEKTIRDKLG